MDREKFKEYMMSGETRYPNRQTALGYAISDIVREDTKLSDMAPDDSKMRTYTYMLVLEELSELQKEVVKRYRNGEAKSDKYAILEESADVYICMLSLLNICGITREEFARAVSIKIRETLDNYDKEDSDGGTMDNNSPV